MVTVGPISIYVQHLLCAGNSWCWVSDLGWFLFIWFVSWSSLILQEQWFSGQCQITAAFFSLNEEDIILLFNRLSLHYFENRLKEMWNKHIQVFLIDTFICRKENMRTLAGYRCLVAEIVIYGCSYSIVSSIQPINAHNLCSKKQHWRISGLWA